MVSPTKVSTRVTRRRNPTTSPLSLRGSSSHRVSEEVPLEPLRQSHRGEEREAGGGARRGEERRRGLTAQESQEEKRIKRQKHEPPTGKPREFQVRTK